MYQHESVCWLFLLFTFFGSFAALNAASAAALRAGPEEPNNEDANDKTSPLHLSDSEPHEAILEPTTYRQKRDIIPENKMKETQDDGRESDNRGMLKQELDLPIMHVQEIQNVDPSLQKGNIEDLETELQSHSNIQNYEDDFDDWGRLDDLYDDQIYDEDAGEFLSSVSPAEHLSSVFSQLQKRRSLAFSPRTGKRRSLFLTPRTGKRSLAFTPRTGRAFSFIPLSERALSFIPRTGRALAFTPRTGKRDATTNPEKRRLSFIPRTGKRQLSFSPFSETRELAFNPRTGKRSLAFTPRTGKRDTLYNTRLGKRILYYIPRLIKRPLAFTPRTGKRAATGFSENHLESLPLAEQRQE